MPIKECRKHTYLDLKYKWLVQFEKAKNMIKFNDPYDLLEEMDTINGKKYRRNKNLMFIERCLLYGIYLHSIPTEENHFKLPKSDTFTSLTVTSSAFNNPQSFLSSDVLMIFNIWKQLRFKLNLMTSNSVFFDKNIGNCLKTWASKYLFDGKKKLGTSITDLTYIINNS